MTNYERIKNMSIEEMAEFLRNTDFLDDTPWREFYGEFCETCHSEEYLLNDGRKMRLHECDFEDGKCPHGSCFIWWLNQEADQQ